MLLVIDSATAACSVALIDGERLVDERHELIGRGHAERLMPLIEELLAGRRPAAIAVDCGPGSFTGVRVGLAAAHGLAIGWQVPVRGYSSTALIAAQADDGEVGVALQAGHGELFVQSYRRDPLVAQDALRSLPTEQAAAAVGAELVLGSGAEALVTIRAHGRWAEAFPRASDLRLVPQPLRTLPPLPIYGRGPDAKPMQ